MGGCEGGGPVPAPLPDGWQRTADGGRDAEVSCSAAGSEISAVSRTRDAVRVRHGPATLGRVATVVASRSPLGNRGGLIGPVAFEIACPAYAIG